MGRRVIMACVYWFFEKGIVAYAGLADRMKP